MLGGLFSIFLVFFVKIGISDILRKLRERRMTKGELVALQSEDEKTTCSEV